MAFYWCLSKGQRVSCFWGEFEATSVGIVGLVVAYIGKTMKVEI